MRTPNEVWQKMQELSNRYKELKDEPIDYDSDTSMWDQVLKRSEIVAQEEILLWVLNNEADGNN